MADKPPKLPAGNRDGQEPESADEDRRMLALRNARVRAAITRGEVPPGYRVSDDGTSFVRLGNPAWPVRPLDPFCTTYSEPSIELAVLIRKLLPNFDPESDRRGWLEVAELVRRSGRPAAEVQAMGHDELVAFFRYLTFDGQIARPAALKRSLEATMSTAPKPPVVEDCGRETADEKTTSMILREWLGDPVRKPKLVATLSSERAGELIGRSATSVREAGDAWKELKAEFKTYREFRRYEKNRRNR